MLSSNEPNKKRLYLALYPSRYPDDKLRQYHWGFLIGPKEVGVEDVAGVRCHADRIQKNGPWVYRKDNIQDVRASPALLGRIVIAKIRDEQRLISLLESLPIDNGDPNWTCRSWISHALAQIQKDEECVGTSKLDWARLEPFARDFIGVARYTGTQDLKPKPTWDLLADEELIV